MLLDCSEAVFTRVVGKNSTVNVVVLLREFERSCWCVASYLPNELCMKILNNVMIVALIYELAVSVCKVLIVCMHSVLFKCNTSPRSQKMIVTIVQSSLSLVYRKYSIDLIPLLRSSSKQLLKKCSSRWVSFLYTAGINTLQKSDVNKLILLVNIFDVQ